MCFGPFTAPGPNRLDGRMQPKINVLPAPPPDPKQANSDVRKAKDEAARRARANKGRKATILTGNRGVEDTPMLRRKTLLGQ